MRNCLGVLSYVNGMHWTDEQLKEIEKCTCLADKSALDGVADTTNSVLKESRHLSDEFDDRYGGNNWCEGRVFTFVY